MNKLCVVRPGAGMSLLTIAVGFALTGCGSMSGLSGSSQFACAAPPGVQCQSVSGTYANSLHGGTQAQRAGTAPPATYRSPAPRASYAAMGMQTEPRALRSDSRVMRMWVKAWEDQDHDLVDESAVYVQVDDGRWLVEHAQARSRQAYAPVQPPADTGPDVPRPIPKPAAQEAASAAPAEEAPADDKAAGAPSQPQQ